MTDTKLLQEITLRELAQGDEVLINEFFDCMGGESRSLFNRRDYNRRGALKFCAHPDPTRRYFLAEYQGKMAGYVFFMDFDTSIPQLGLAVRDELAGRGLGGYLVSFAVDMAKKAGKGGIQLTTHVANLRAQTLYEKMGFTLIGPTKNGTEFFYLYRYREKNEAGCGARC